MKMNIHGNVLMSEEEQAFLVYHTCQGFQQSDFLTKFNDRFSKNLMQRRFETFLENIGDESKRTLLLAAQRYDWFNPELPPNLKVSLSSILRLSTVNWSMEQRAYVLHFRARGNKPTTILEGLNKQYRSNREVKGLNLEFAHLNSKPELMRQLQDETPNFSWWTPEPKSGTKERKKMDRRSRVVEAKRRLSSDGKSFKQFSKAAAAAEAEAAERGEGNFFSDENEEDVLLSSSPPTHTPSETSSSSRHPQGSNQAFGSPSPSPFRSNSSPAGVPTSPRRPSALPHLSFPATPGPYSDHDDDPFSKPFHSPDASSPSFPSFSPTARRFPGQQPSHGPALPSSSPLSPHPGGTPSASPTTSSPTYGSPYAHLPPNSPSNLAHGPCRSTSTREGRASEQYNYRDARPGSRFSDYDSRSSPLSSHSHGLLMQPSAPYSPGVLPPSSPYRRNAPQESQNSSPSLGHPTPRSSSSSSQQQNRGPRK